jgi:hypothetical protein
MALKTMTRWRTVVFLVLCCGIATAAWGQADRGQVRRNFSGPCASTDPVYGRIANATGGQQYRLRPSEIEKSGAVMESKLSHPVDVFFATGGLGRRGERTFEIPVDSTIESVTFSATVQCKESISIWRPGGTLVTPGGAAGFLDTEMTAARILTVNRPETGVWRLRVLGGGEYSVSVRAKTELDLGGFEFVRLGGRPGHEGLFKIEGEPTSAQQIGQARVHGPYQTATFKLVAESGETIQPVRLQSEGDREEFTGTLTLPTRPFRVAVEGVDERGRAYQRIYVRLFQLQSIEIASLTRVADFPAGSTTRMVFQIHNLGTAGNFRAQLVWVGRNFVKTPPATPLALAAGAAANIEADIDIPANAVAATEVNVTLSVERTTPPAAQNWMVVTGSVTPAAR